MIKQKNLTGFCTGSDLDPRKWYGPPWIRESALEVGEDLRGGHPCFHMYCVEGIPLQGIWVLPPGPKKSPGFRTEERATCALACSSVQKLGLFLGEIQGLIYSDPAQPPR